MLREHLGTICLLYTHHHRRRRQHSKNEKSASVYTVWKRDERESESSASKRENECERDKKIYDVRKRVNERGEVEMNRRSQCAFAHRPKNHTGRINVHREKKDK